MPHRRKGGSKANRVRIVGAAALVAAMLPTFAVAATNGSPAGVVKPQAAFGPFTVDVTNREDVRQFYNLVYQSTVNVPLGWTGGDVATCQKGTVSPAWLTATLTRINYYRAMSGMPAVTFNGTDAGTSVDLNNSRSQAAALLRLANPNAQAHSPSPAEAPTCRTEEAVIGSNGNQAGAMGPEGIDSLMYDGTALGHRRNMLNPSISTMGAGGIPRVSAGGPIFVQAVLTPTLPARPPVRSGFVAWPPAGFVPYQVVPARWSFSLPNTDFSQASVTMKKNGVATPSPRRCFDPYPTPNDGTLCAQYGETAISWSAEGVADGITWPKPASDDVYTVTINNARVNGVAQNFTYQVTVMDPTVSSAANTASQAPTGPSAPLVNSSPAYTVPPVADATGYQWRTTPLVPGDFVDGAEAGLGNWTSEQAAPFPAISQRRSASGNSSFFLAQGSVGGGSPPDQKLVLNRSVLATATSELRFDRTFLVAWSSALHVDVSIDDGQTWTETFTEVAPHPNVVGFGDLPFGSKTVSLGQYAGRVIKLRFRLAFVKGGGWSNCCTDDGVYFDNVALNDIQTAGTPTVGAVGAAPSFTFNNPAVGTVAIDVRPQFANPTFGSSPGAWSPTKLVTSVAPEGSVTTLSSSVNPSIPGQSVTYVARVTPATTGGDMAFVVNGNALCQDVPVVSGQASCTHAYPVGTEGGTKSMVAWYSGTGAVDPSQSAPFAQILDGPVSAGFQLSSSPNPAYTGQPVTFTAQVTPSDGVGTVYFGVDSPGCSAVPLTAAGTATCTTTFATPNLDRWINASFSGSPKFLATQEQPIVHQVVFQKTTTTITSSNNPSAPGQSVTYTATVTPTPGGGNVIFYDNDTAISGCESRPLTSGQATCTTTYGGTGPHPIVAGFNGDFISGYYPSGSAALSQSVGSLSASTTNLTSSKNPAAPGENVTFTATVNAANLSGTVTFTEFGWTLPGCSKRPVNGAGIATCTASFFSAETSTIGAYYSGTATVASSFDSLVENVQNPPPAPLTGVDADPLIGAGAAITFAPPPIAGASDAPAAASASDATGFNVYMGTTSNGQSATPVNSSRILATAKGFNVGGLTPGQRYYFKVRRLSAAGLSALSNETSIVAAKAPTVAAWSVAAAGKNRSVAVSWLAPSSTGGSPITRYDVFVASPPNAALVKANASPLPATARSYTVTGLTNGEPVAVSVVPTNVVGSGPASALVSATPKTVPNRPANVLVARGNASATLQWVAPDELNGAPLTGFNVYKATASGGQTGTPVNASPLAASARTFTVNGLTNNKKYFFTVKAANAAGLSAASLEVSATPTAAVVPPGAPQQPKAKAGNQSVAVSWAAPTSTGGSAITAYNVYASTRPNGQGATPVNPSPLPSSARSYNATGLTNGRQMFFTVKAVNALGAGLPSGEVSATPSAPSTVPAAPALTVASAGVKSVALTWLAPVWNGGSNVTGYNVYKATTSGGQTGTPVNGTPLGAGVRNYNVTGLTTGTTYFFTVKAINAAGSSVASNQKKARPT